MLRREIYRFCQRYIKRYEGFSYDFETNGERLLVDNLSRFNFDTVFDVGANVGSWTRMASERFPGATIHSFELSGSTYEHLCANLADIPSAKLNNIGLSDSEEVLTYKDYGVDSGVNTILVDANYHDRKVKPELREGRVSTGDNYCAQHDIERIDFLKIDVEGAESLVLAGFESMLGKSAVRLVQFEYGYTNGDAHFLMKDFYKFFGRFGYVVGVLKPGGARFTDFSYKLNDFSSGPNFVAIHGSDLELRSAIKDPGS